MKKTLKKILLSISIIFSSIFPLFNVAAEESFQQDVYPVVILGGGVGGLTSAIYLGRAGISPLLLEGKNPGGALATSPHIQNWPGEIDISGLDLTNKIRAQAIYNGAAIRSEEVISVDFSERPFRIVTRDVANPDKMANLKAHSIIIALGSNPNLLHVPGENKYWSKGVYSCAVCDGSLYKNKVVAVVGGGDASVVEAQYLSNLAKKVYLLVRKDTFRAVEKQRLAALLSKENVEVLFQTTVSEVRGDGEKVVSLLIQNEKSGQSTLPVDALFLAIGAKPNSWLFKNQIALDPQNYIVRLQDQETSIPGVYVVGDVSDPHYKQAISAAGEGAIAALQAEKYLNQTHNLPKVVLAHPQEKHEQNAFQKAPQKNGNGIIEITSVKEFENELRTASTPILVDFYATWCGPCNKFSSLFESLARAFSGKIKFIKVNVDHLSELSDRYQIKSMPTLLVFNKRGDLLKRRVGTKEISQFTTQMEKANKESNSAMDALFQ